MSDSDKRRGLGRGLAALLGEAGVGAPPPTGETARQVRMVPVELLRPGRFQPRHNFDPEQIESLAQSVREKGILQPILVRRHPDGPETFYEIVAGERRWRAAQVARLHEVPVILRDFADREALEIALVENVQRANLSPVEEAEGYGRLLREFDYTQDALAKAVGKSRSHVANTLRLLNLPDAVKQMLDDGRLTAGHARALLAAADPLAAARRVVNLGLNVRQTERLVTPGAKKRTAAPPPAADANTRALERDLTAAIGLKVELHASGQGGSLTIHYRSLDQLDAVIARLKG